MRKAELVTQLEGLKEFTSVVSIDTVVALIQRMDPEVVTKTVTQMTQEMFDLVTREIGRAHV